jgi:formylglycine-generating enzyme required for sulfatase activity
MARTRLAAAAAVFAVQFGAAAPLLGQDDVLAAPPPLARAAGTAFRDCAECPEMVVVPPGVFLLGSPPTEPERSDDEDDTAGPGGRQVQVTIARSFAIGRHEVTWDEWEACLRGGGCDGYMPLLPPIFEAGTTPVIGISWDDAQAYVRWLNARVPGTPYRLPTEAEWEYAARAGTTTPFHTGATITPDQANYFSDYAYGDAPTRQFRRKTVPVGSFPPNAFGLHDMHGNVWEWVQDCYAEAYGPARADASAAEPEDGVCQDRGIRGGAWYFRPAGARSAFRFWFPPGDRDMGSMGFRVVRDLADAADPLP